MVDVLQSLWNYTTVSLTHSTDSYGSGYADAVSRRAVVTGLQIATTQSFLKDATEFVLQQRALLKAGCRIIVLICQRSDGARFIRTALQEGVGGEGWLWIGGDTFAASELWSNDPVLATDE
eukprot:1186161-Prymnesium_polylepis.1